MTSFSHSTARNAYGLEFVPRKAIHVLGAAFRAMTTKRTGDIITSRDLVHHANGPLSIAEGMDYWLKAGMAVRVATMQGNRPLVGYVFNESRVRAFYDAYNLTDGKGLAPYEQFLIYLITKAWELRRPIQRRDAYDLFSRGSTIRREILDNNGLLEAFTDPEHSGRYFYQATDIGTRVATGWQTVTEMIDEWRASGYVAELKAVTKSPTQSGRHRREELFAKAVQANR